MCIFLKKYFGSRTLFILVIPTGGNPLNPDAFFIFIESKFIVYAMKAFYHQLYTQSCKDNYAKIYTEECLSICFQIVRQRSFQFITFNLYFQPLQYFINIFIKWIVTSENG